MSLGWAQVLRGDLTGALARLREVDEESTAAHDAMFSMHVSVDAGDRAGLPGDMRTRARAAAEAALQRASELFEFHQDCVHAAFGIVHLAAGDASAAWEAYEAARERTGDGPPDGVDIHLGGAGPVGMR